MGARILIADDCPEMQARVAALLEREGHVVVALAFDGAEAIQMAQAFTPDVAVLDLSMPVVDGLEAAREIRLRCPTIRQVLLTMHTSEEHIALAVRSGLDAFVAKSDAADDLARAVREVMAGGRFLSLKPSRLLLESILHQH